METNTQVTNWMTEELKELNTTTDGQHPILPALKFEENKIVEFTVDFTLKFPKWQGTGGRPRIGETSQTVVKAIIPVTHMGEKKVLWLNVKNPLYGEIVKQGAAGKTTFKVIQTGKQSETKYTLVE